MENNNKEQITISAEKKTWAMPELIVIDKKVIEGGLHAAGYEHLTYNIHS